MCGVLDGGGGLHHIHVIHSFRPGKQEYLITYETPYEIGYNNGTINSAFHIWTTM